MSLERLSICGGSVISLLKPPRSQPFNLGFASPRRIIQKRLAGPNARTVLTIVRVALAHVCVCLKDIFTHLPKDNVEHVKYAGKV